MTPQDAAWLKIGSGPLVVGDVYIRLCLVRALFALVRYPSAQTLSS